MFGTRCDNTDYYRLMLTVVLVKSNNGQSITKLRLHYTFRRNNCLIFLRIYNNVGLESTALRRDIRSEATASTTRLTVQ